MQQAPYEKPATGLRVERASGSALPGHHDSFSGTQLFLLLAGFVLVSVCGAARGDEQPAASSLIRYEKTANQEAPSSEKSFLLGVSLRLSPSAWDEAGAHNSTGLPSAYSRSLTRYLNLPKSERKGLSLLNGFAQVDDEGLTVGSFQAGYGQVFAGESVFSQRHNGTGLEEPSFLYLKASFRF